MKLPTYHPSRIFQAMGNVGNILGSDFQINNFVLKVCPTAFIHSIDSVHEPGLVRISISEITHDEAEHLMLALKPRLPKGVRAELVGPRGGIFNQGWPEPPHVATRKHFTDYIAENYPQVIVHRLDESEPGQLTLYASGISEQEAEAMIVDLDLILPAGVQLFIELWKAVGIKRPNAPWKDIK